MNSKQNHSKTLLGEYPISYSPFQNLDTVFTEILEKHLSPRHTLEYVHKQLLQCIQEAASPCFLLPAILEYIERVSKEGVLPSPYRFVDFEFWLNKFSGISDEENLKVRAKIIGTWVPREAYQKLFPIGMNKTFDGSHFVAAHASPDIDTTTASFWGWVDAFGAKVADGVHYWSLPGTFPDSHFTFVFSQFFSKYVFSQLARSVPTLTLNALDLVTQKDMIKMHMHRLASTVDHAHAHKAIILVDDHDHYRGDWRVADAEEVLQIVLLFDACIRWFENSIHTTLISLFAKKTIHLKDIVATIGPIFEIPLHTIPPVKVYTERQKNRLHDYVTKVIGLPQGLDGNFLQLGEELDKRIQAGFQPFYAAIRSLSDAALFTAHEELIEDRQKIFARLEKIIELLDQVTHAVYHFVNQLCTMVETKEKVLGVQPQHVVLKSDVDEVKSKIADFDHVTVVTVEGEKSLIPVGVIHAHDLRKPVLGTVSLRDFSNEQETQMASYLEVISVVDHHKTSLKTMSAPCFLIADAQSANTLVAELSFSLNAKYSHMGIPEEVIDKQLEDIQAKTPHKLQQMRHLLQLKMNAEHCKKSGFFVDPQREFAEYYTCLYAILDDTDLLTKVSTRDVLCVTTLLNRMKSITQRAYTQIITLDDIPQDASFASNAVQRILQNDDMYSIYKTMYAFKEQEVADNLAQCIAGKPSSIFTDTKEQNGCCRVGQTKIFNTNYPFFKEHAQELRALWVNDARAVNKAKPQVTFHMHMISTVAGADEVYSGHITGWDHEDEIWLWIPPTQPAVDRLVRFLIAFQATPAVQNNRMSVSFFGENARELRQIFEQNFPAATQTPLGSQVPQGLPIACLKFIAGSINSRKAQITPCLPRLVP